MFNETSYLGESPGQIASLAAGAGCGQPDLAAAIAMAESSGNPRAHNPVPPDDSYGLWQINMRGNLGPERRAQFGLTSNEQLYDPATNARAMVAISGGCANFNPWTTFTSGRYRAYYSTPSSGGGTVASGGSQTSDPSGGGASSFLPGLDTITSPVELFSGLPAWVPIALLGIGAYFLLS